MFLCYKDEAVGENEIKNKAREEMLYRTLCLRTEEAIGLACVSWHWTGKNESSHFQTREKEPIVSMVPGLDILSEVRGSGVCRQ
jgi:hypothetical protein